jgi:hypothetical protein
MSSYQCWAGIEIFKHLSILIRKKNEFRIREPLLVLGPPGKKNRNQKNRLVTAIQKGNTEPTIFMKEPAKNKGAILLKTMGIYQNR